MEGAPPAYVPKNRSLSTKRSFSLNHRKTKHGSPETSNHGFYNIQHRPPTHRRVLEGGFTLSPKQLVTSSPSSQTLTNIKCANSLAHQDFTSLILSTPADSYAVDYKDRRITLHGNHASHTKTHCANFKNGPQKLMTLLQEPKKTNFTSRHSTHISANHFYRSPHQHLRPSPTCALISTGLSHY